MTVSDEMKAANERADEVLAKQEARANELDRKSEAFADDRAAELDRAVQNAKAYAEERGAEARERIAKAREHESHREPTRRSGEVQAPPPSRHDGAAAPASASVASRAPSIDG